MHELEDALDSPALHLRGDIHKHQSRGDDPFAPIAGEERGDATERRADQDRGSADLAHDVPHVARIGLEAIVPVRMPIAFAVATLVERDGRELPIQANVVGSHVRLSPRQHIKLLGPDTLKLEIKQIP